MTFFRVLVVLSFAGILAGCKGRTETKIPNAADVPEAKASDSGGGPAAKPPSPAKTQKAD